MSTGDDTNATVPPGQPTASDRTGWLKFAAVLAAMVVAVVGAFAVGRVTAPDSEPSAVSTSTTLTSTTTVPPTTSTTTTTTTTIPITTGDYVERVAQIAAEVSPAVVQLETRRALGSGVIYSTDGYILTAAHVLDDEVEVTVRLYDGRTLEGEVIGVHDVTDVGVVKVEASPDLPTAELALGVDVQVGQLAVALGSPFGLEQTATSGIVSAVDRILDGVIMVQTDAAINPGNSGGPLVDADGRVIGINDLIWTTSGGFEGIGFAINIDLAVMVAEQLVAGEEVQLAYLGVTVSPAAGDTPGALVELVKTGSPASRAGIEIGDIIITVDGEEVTSNADLRAAVISRRPGDVIEIVLLRDAEHLSFEITLASAGE